MKTTSEQEPSETVNPNLRRGNPPGTHYRRAKKIDNPNKIAFSKAEAARMLSIGPKVLEALIASGAIKAAKIAENGWRISRAEIDQFLARGAK